MVTPPRTGARSGSLQAPLGVPRTSPSPYVNSSSRFWTNSKTHWSATRGSRPRQITAGCGDSCAGWLSAWTCRERARVAAERTAHAPP